MVLYARARPCGTGSCGPERPHSARRGPLPYEGGSDSEASNYVTTNAFRQLCLSGQGSRAPAGAYGVG